MPESSPPQVDVERIDMGWVVCKRTSWEHIDAELALVWELEQCSTWGQVRQLTLSDSLVELVGETDTAPDDWPVMWPADDTPFAIDLSDSEWYDRTLWLGRAGLDFVEAMSAYGLPEHALDDSFYIGGEVAFVLDERIDAVMQLLSEQGLDVRVHD